jgi:putative (di)nucleoside polyphosphate hydrolase
MTREPVEAAASGAAYRPCVGIALANAEGKVFLGRRKPRKGGERMPGFEWQMPQGGLDPGEDPREAALRELREETSIVSATFLDEAPEWLSYDLPESALGRWRGRYRGQIQKWFLLRFHGDESEIDILRPWGGAHAAEFDAWRWEDLQALPSLVVPFKRSVYEKVVEVFAPRLRSALPAPGADRID